MNVTPTLAVCAIFKREGRYLEEWVNFHSRQGVDSFFLYDNNDDFSDACALDELSSRRDVTIIKWPLKGGQLAAYTHFIGFHSRDYDWVGFLDIDEFVNILSDLTFKELLMSCDKYVAVLFNWRVFGPSGHLRSPSGFVIDSYCKRLPLEFPVNRHVKSFVRSLYVDGPGPNPHIAQIRGEACNARGEKICNQPLSDITCQDVCVINHYFTKSKEDWIRKISRGKADMIVQDQNYDSSIFDHIAECATELDTSLLETVKNCGYSRVWRL